MGAAYLGFMFTQQKMWARKFWYRFTIITMYFNAGLIPWYITMRNLHLTNNFLAYILPAKMCIRDRFDTYHWYCGSGRLDDLYFAAQNCHRMVNFHLNDGVAGKSRDEQEDQVRAMPMTTGIIDAARIYQLFEKNGYKGPVMCEPMVPSTDRFAVQDVEKSK